MMANVVKEWGERQPDGSVIVYTQYDDGTTSSRSESWQQNQGLPPGGGQPGGISEEHRQGLRQAGYGDWSNLNLTEADWQQIAAGAQRGGIGQGGGVTPDWPALLRSLTGSNQQQFDWLKEQFNRNLEEQQREYNQSAYGNLANSLLSGAASLRGPADYYQYANYLNQGRDVFGSLFGANANPKFGGVAGYSPGISVSDVLQKLGIIPGGQQGTPGQAQGQDPNAALDWIGSHWGGLQQMAQQNGVNVSDPQTYRNWIATNWLPKNTPGKSPSQVAMDLGMSLPAQSPTAATSAPMSPRTDAFAQATSPLTGGATTPPPAPNPWQIHPGVWDSMSDTAKQLILGSVQQGNTPTGAWTPADYLSQMMAARPKGVAPTNVTQAFAPPQSYF